MAGSATLGSNLIDSLITDVVDGLRGELHPAFGIRQFNVTIIARTYASGYVDDGSYTDVETVIDPQPLVLPYKTEFQLMPCGLDEAGLVQLQEVSLTYTEAELVGSYSQGVEWLYKISDAQGQEIADTFWVLKTKPYPDRIKTLGWIMELEKAGVQS